MDRRSIEVTQHQAMEHVEMARGRIAESITSKIEPVNIRARDFLKPPTWLTARGLYRVHRGTKNDRINTIDGVDDIYDGRIDDLKDGALARMLDFILKELGIDIPMKTQAGALSDVVADKLGMALIANAAIQNKSLPMSVIRYLEAKNTVFAGLFVLTAINHPGEKFDTPLPNKAAMALENIGAGALLKANAYRLEKPEENKHQMYEKIGWTALGASAVPAFFAAHHNLKRARKNSRLD